jgi:hypothetical protein
MEKQKRDDFLTGRQNGSSPGLRPEVIEFKDNKTKNFEEFREVFEENLPTMKDAVMIWRDEDDEVYYCSTEMLVSTLVGFLEMAKHYVIEGHE